MANKDDDTWFADYTFGQMTGKGWGFYGELGNQLYESEQKQKREREMRESRYQEETTTKNLTRPPRLHSRYKEKPWSNLFAIIGFLVGAGVMYSQPAPSLIISLVVGLITGYISGRFYKLILVSGMILLIWWVVSQNP
jgi:hypothetical protein